MRYKYKVIFDPKKKAYTAHYKQAYYNIDIFLQRWNTLKSCKNKEGQPYYEFPQPTEFDSISAAYSALCRHISRLEKPRKIYKGFIYG